MEKLSNVDVSERLSLINSSQDMFTDRQTETERWMDRQEDRQNLMYKYNPGAIC